MRAPLLPEVDRSLLDAGAITDERVETLEQTALGGPTEAPGAR